MPVALSLFQYNPAGQPALVKELPAALHPTGVLTLDAPLTEKGRYLLKLAFGAAKTKDEIIEMPIQAGE